MHIYTILEISQIALRLRDEGMGLKHAVHLTASAYGVEPDAIYVCIAKHGME